MFVVAVWTAVAGFGPDPVALVVQAGEMAALVVRNRSATAATPSNEVNQPEAKRPQTLESDPAGHGDTLGIRAWVGSERWKFEGHMNPSAG